MSAAQKTDIEVTPARARIEEVADELGRNVHPSPALSEARVAFVIDLMVEGIFETGDTAADMSECWGLHEVTCKRITGEASRRVKTAIDPEYVRLRLATKLDQSLREADGISDTSDRIAARVKLVSTYEPLIGVGAARNASHTTVNVLVANPEWIALRTKIMQALEPYPDARQSVVLALGDGK